MNKIVFILSFCILVSCTVSELGKDSVDVSSLKPVYTASIESPDTKIYVDSDLKTHWTAGDHISIFTSTYNEEYSFDGQTGDNDGSFSAIDDKFHSGSSVSTIYAVYPYLEGTSVSSNGVITLSLPAVQSYAENSYGLGANTMVAATENKSSKALYFKNLCGYVVVRLYGTGIVKSITLTGNNGEKIAGTATVSPVYGQAPEVVMSSSATTSITLDCGEGVVVGESASDATDFWFAVPPVTFTKGFNVQIIDIADKCIEKSTHIKREITRRKKNALAPIEVSLSSEHSNILKYLTFTSEGSTTIKLIDAYGNNTPVNTPVLLYSYDKVNWTQWDYSGLVFTKSHPLYICGDNPNGINNEQCTSKFWTSGDRYSISGDIMSLISKDNDVLDIPNSYCFSALFSECSNMTSAPDLPATILTVGCYTRLFEFCKSLSVAPELPATTLADYCYCGMFENCTNLTAAPVLPAKSMADYCYSNMFSRCTSLASAPKLIATSLAKYCYADMFNGCVSLTIAPDLPSPSLADWCYTDMFSGCTNLTVAPKLSALTLSYRCYQWMFRNCSGLTIAPDLPASILVDGCYFQMFYGCTKLQYVKCLATDIHASYCTNEWLSGVSSQGTFIKAKGMGSWTSGSSGIPNGWMVEGEGNGGNEDCSYIDEYGVNHGNGIEIDGIIWAPVNCGYKPSSGSGDGFPYGKLYQWGRSNGQGYGAPYEVSIDPRLDESTPTTSRLWTGVNGEENTNSFYQKGNSYFDWDWISNGDSKYWRKPDGGKTEHDPCPDGWRIPTWTELSTLFNGDHSGLTQYKGLYGMWFSGSQPCTDSNNNKIFLPASGERHPNSTAQNRGVDGFYWSSSVVNYFSWSLKVSSSGPGKWYMGKAYGLSVRCVRDNKPNDEYVSSNYSLDGHVNLIKKATIGNGVDMVIIGDAFSDKDQDSFSYYANIAKEAIFEEEPYASLSERFNVYTINAVSDNGRVGGSTHFLTDFISGSTIFGDAPHIFSFVKSYLPQIDLSKAPICVILNDRQYAGYCSWWKDNSSICYVPLCPDEETYRGTVKHEFGGHGFGKLLDEYYDSGTIPSSTVQEQISWRNLAYGFYANVDYTNNPEEVQWTHFLNDSRYSGLVGIYEGAATYQYGAYRPTDYSIMRFNSGGFNAPSREAIYKKVMLFSEGDDWQYDYEQFVSFDTVARNTDYSRLRRAKSQTNSRCIIPLDSPRFYDNSVSCGKFERD